MKFKTEGFIKRDCFTCDEVIIVNSNIYNKIGLVRCSSGNLLDILISRTKFYLQNHKHKFFEVAQSCQLLGCWQLLDNFVLDVLYHKLCYINQAVKNNKRVDITGNELDTATAVIDEPFETELHGKGILSFT